MPEAPRAEPAAPGLARADAWTALGLAIAAAAYGLFLFLGRGQTGGPVIHDEFAYLLQARMLASGHLTMPSPPLPEFFEAPHVLLVPRYAAKYFPGHAALLAPFVAAGVPWLFGPLLLGLTCALLYLAARLCALPRWASLAAPCALAGASPVVDAFPSYLAQSTSVFLCTAALAAAAALGRRPSPARAAALGVCAGWECLNRPFSGLALAAAGAGLLLALGAGRKPRLAVAFALPLAAAAGLGLGVCRATTGSWTRSPWGLYAAQYMPFDGPGLGEPQAPPPLRTLPPHVRALARQWELSRRSYTASRLPAEIVRRAGVTASLVPTVALLAAPLALAGLTQALAFALGFLVLDFAAMLGFHFVHGLYLFELAPALLLLAAAGASRLAGLSRGEARPPGAGALRIVALGVAALALLLGAVRETRERIESLGPAATRPYDRLRPAFAEVERARGLVFLRYPPGWDPRVDLTYNEPDLGRARAVRALDLGARDAELMRAFPDRPAFLLDLGSGRLGRLR